MIEGIIISSISFVLFLIIHFLWFYYRPPIYRWRLVSRLALFFLLLYSLLFWLLPFSNWFNVLNLDSIYSRIFAYLNGVVIYVFLFFSYAQFYFLIDRGVSARILVEIGRSVNKKLSHEELKVLYNPEKLQMRRVQDMLYGKYIVFENGYYRMTFKGKLNAAVFDFCKRYLHLNPGG
ncbi:hypothetical protein ACFL3E_01540 [Patescibacteria group bacterium]